MDLRRAATAVGLVLSFVPLMAAHSAATAAPRRASLCAPPADTVAPAATKVTFGKSTINVDAGSRTQTVTVTASDTSGVGNPSGVAAVRLTIEGNRSYRFVPLSRTSGTPASGQWTGHFTVSKYAHPGSYSIGFLDVTDAARNEQVYSGGGPVPEGPNALSLHPGDDPTFDVTGTPATRPNRTPGTLSTLSLTPGTVNTVGRARRVQVQAHFTGAVPHRVGVELESSKRSAKSRFVFLHGVLHRGRGHWSGTVRIPQWLGDETLQLSLYAGFGPNFRPSERAYGSSRLQSMHLPHALTVVSGVDRSKPALTSLSFTPKTVDSTNGPEQVTVTARAADTGSGVRSIDVNGGIRHGVNGVAGGLYPFGSAGVGYLSSDDFHVRLHRTASGAWTGTTTVRQCVPSGTYKLSVSLVDRASNYRSYSTRQLAQAHLRSTVAVTSKHGDVVAPYVYSAATYGADSDLFLNFSEGVADVSTSTLTVYPLAPRSSRFTQPATVSSIVCANGKDTVDCSGSGGLVTSAVLTVPDMNPGDKYQVYANLDDVTQQLVDGNGNPMDWNYDAVEVKDS